MPGVYSIRGDDVNVKRALWLFWELLAVLADGVRVGLAAADFRGRLAAWRELLTSHLT